MTVTLTFTITFHGPFAVATGAAGLGLHAPIDGEVPLPGSSLKGLLRAQAETVLGLTATHVAAVFGLPRRPSPWAFVDAGPDHKWITDRQARIKVDDEGAVEPGALQLGAQAWARTATFDVEQIAPIAADNLPRHELILHAAARSVSALGGGRRRGAGWVSIARTDVPWTSADTRALIALRERAGAEAGR